MFNYVSGESIEPLVCALGDAQRSHLQSFQPIFGLSIIQNIIFILWGDSGNYLRTWRFRKALAHRWRNRIRIEPMAAGNRSGFHRVLWGILMFSWIYLTPKLNVVVTNPKVKRCGGSSGLYIYIIYIYIHTNIYRGMVINRLFSPLSSGISYTHW